MHTGCLETFGNSKRHGSEASVFLGFTAKLEQHPKCMNHAISIIHCSYKIINYSEFKFRHIAPLAHLFLIIQDTAGVENMPCWPTTKEPT